MSELPGYYRQNWPVARQFERRALESRLVLTANNGSVYRGWCNDIGEGGLGATIAAPLEVRSEVALEFAVPNCPDPIQVKAIVRYTNGFRFGFEFLNLTPEQRKLVLAYVSSSATPKPPARPAVRKQ